MPHVTITTSPNLVSWIDWSRVVPAMHAELAARELAALSDLKTRVQTCAYALCGDVVAAGQVVATLVTTNPRSADAEKAMAEIVLSHLKQAVDAVPEQIWIQCCVFFQHIPKAQYLKLELNAP